MNKKTGAIKKRRKSFQLLMPLLVLFMLLLVNLIADPIIMGRNANASSFFSIVIRENNLGNLVFGGSIISILNSASELAILSIGMTLVIASSKGPDIGIGAVAAVAASVFVFMLRLTENVTLPWVIMSFLVAAAASMLIGVFNGTLVAKLKIQPMIATLIMFTSARSIAYAINGGASPKMFDDITAQLGSFIPGVPIPTPVFAVILYALIFFLIFKFTNLRLYVQSVGINERAARLNGINPDVIKIVCFVLLGFCVAGAGVINASRMQRVDHMAVLSGIEMDAILAVAIGGNLLSGGKFSIVGSMIGAYTIETLNVTLLRLGVGPEPIRAYKAAFIILLMVLSSPVVKEFFSKLWVRVFVQDRLPVKEAE